MATPDTRGMHDLDRQLLVNNPHWQQVIEAYLEMAADAAEKSTEESGPRWSDRIISLNGLEPEELSAIHGQLIALGWLNFQFDDGHSGLVYRVSSEGRALLKWARDQRCEQDAESQLADPEPVREGDQVEEPVVVESAKAEDAQLEEQSSSDRQVA